MPRLRSRAALFAATTLAATTAVASFTMGSSSASPTGDAPAGSRPAGDSTAGTTDAMRGRGITVQGAVHHRGPVSRGVLAGMPQRTVTMTYQTGDGAQTHRYSGPTLLEVLERAEPAFSSDKHDPLRYAILVEATDGFLAALSWGEIEPELEGKRVLVALTQDGKKLDRPRLVIPGDSHGARQVYDARAIVLLRLTPDLARGRVVGLGDMEGVGDMH